MPILDWLDKEQAVRKAKTIPYRLLKPVKKLSYGDPKSENMLIQGDNLDALKALLPLYAGKVKCIFIDPPYNTKSAFEHYDDNLEHSRWLSVMYPRLELLRELLTDDGTIWVAIDDNEGHYLKVIMDEIFGRKNFVNTIMWKAADSSNNDAKQFSVDHNFVFVYSKVNGWLSKPLARRDKDNKHYKNPDNDPQGAWFSGNVSSPNPRDNLKFIIETPSGRKIKPPSNGWRWSKEKVEEMISRKEIVFSEDETRIIKKTYLANQKGLSPSTVWAEIEDTGHNRQAKYELKKLFPNVDTSELFKTPKPEKLIKKIFSICTNENDFVLDSFLGSGTTAAVAHKMGRRYIGIEMGEHAKTNCVPRLIKVVDGEQGGISESVNWQGGGGFYFYQLGAAIFDEFGVIRPDIRFDELAAHIWYMETRTPLTKKIKTPLLGVHNGKAYYLLYNGILGDRKPQGGNVLTSKILATLVEFDGEKVIYGEATRLGEARLKAENISFKQMPYDVGTH